MIYLNNAATSYPKPSCVNEAVQAYLKGAPASQFRGGESGNKADIEEACRANLGKLLGVGETERIYFTSGATEALNAVICGMAGLFENGNILVTQTEHNSVLRPILNHEALKGFKMTVIPCEKDGEVTKEALKRSLTKDTRALIVNHCSNVTGKVQNMEMMGEFARANNLFFVADAAQSAGCLPVLADDWGVDALAFTGHKSLMGIPGTGGFYINSKWRMRPFKYGGTGRDSRRLTYEDEDYEYEAGTGNMPGIAALLAGTEYILKTGLGNIMAKERALMKLLYEGLEECGGVTVYGSPKACEGPVMSFNLKNLAPSDAAYILQNIYGIITRTGLHCSPLIHKAMGTEEKGTVRVSVSYFTTKEEVNELIQAVKSMAEAGKTL